MSTTIYSGYALPMMNVQQLNDFILRFKKDVKEIVGLEAGKFVATKILQIIDDYPYLSEGTCDSSIQRIAREVVMQGKKRYSKLRETMERDPEVDFNCELCVIPSKEKLLVLLFAEKRKIEELFSSYEEVTYYGYWNNTDPDESCTESEWEERKQDWDNALPGIGIPSENGMTIVIQEGFPDYRELLLKEALYFLPSFKERVEQRANEQVLTMLYQALVKENKEEENYRLYHKARTALQKEENRALLEQARTEASMKLIEIIDEDIFQLSFSDLPQWFEQKNKKGVN